MYYARLVKDGDLFYYQDHLDIPTEIYTILPDLWVDSTIEGNEDAYPEGYVDCSKDRLIQVPGEADLEIAAWTNSHRGAYYDSSITNFEDRWYIGPGYGTGPFIWATPINHYIPLLDLSNGKTKPQQKTYIYNYIATLRWSKLAPIFKSYGLEIPITNNPSNYSEVVAGCLLPVLAMVVANSKGWLPEFEYATPNGVITITGQMIDSFGQGLINFIQAMFAREVVLHRLIENTSETDDNWITNIQGIINNQMHIGWPNS